MANRDYTLTLTGAAQQLSTVYANPQVGGPDDQAFQFLGFQPDPTAVGPMYIGASNAVSTTLYGVRLPTPVGGIPPPPFIMELPQCGPLRLSNFWVIGTAGDEIHIMGIPY